MRLVFEAVDYHAEVWLNGRRLGAHEGSFAPFSFDVTDLIQDDNLAVPKQLAQLPEDDLGQFVRHTPGRKSLLDEPLHLSMGQRIPETMSADLSQGNRLTGCCQDRLDRLSGDLLTGRCCFNL